MFCSGGGTWCGGPAIILMGLGSVTIVLCFGVYLLEVTKPRLPSVAAVEAASAEPNDKMVALDAIELPPPPAYLPSAQTQLEAEPTK